MYSINRLEVLFMRIIIFLFLVVPTLFFSGVLLVSLMQNCLLFSASEAPGAGTLIPEPPEPPMEHLTRKELRQIIRNVERYDRERQLRRMRRRSFTYTY